jgi:hypothetical protein
MTGILSPVLTVFQEYSKGSFPIPRYHQFVGNCHFAQHQLILKVGSRVVVN